MASAGGVNLATAYVQLVPSLKGAAKSIQTQLGSVDGTAAGQRIGSSVASGISGTVGGGFSSLAESADSAKPSVAALSTVVGGVATAVTAVAGAAAAAAGAALGAYADYEQLVGGIETLFGSSADTIMQYASEAYKTAGVSANEYMEQATSFSASLLQGLDGDTAAAAEYTNRAITDMADNANKMGTDMASIQNAYQGFAKSNYTIELGFCPDSLAA